VSTRLQALIDELDARIRNLEELPQPEIRDEVFAILQLVDRLHRTGLARLAELLEDTKVWDSLANDEAINVLLTLYDLLPGSGGERGEASTDRLGPASDTWVELPMAATASASASNGGTANGRSAAAGTAGASAGRREGRPSRSREDR
jgi:hypothetical protein